MELFDFIDALFSKKRFADVPDSEKKKYFFMTQRFMSIKFPVQANTFNIVGINQVQAINFWHNTLTRRFTRKPSFLFTKTEKKKKKDKEEKIHDIKKGIIVMYRNAHQMSPTDFNFMAEIYPDELYKSLKKLETMLKDNNMKV